MSLLEDRNLVGIELLPPPTELKTAHPISAHAANTVLRARNDIRDVLHGRDTRRQVVVVGPCSLHDPHVALDYARLLLPVARELEDQLVILMRAYFEKPRTTVGWKGLVNDPRLDGSCHVAEGLATARQLLLEINEIGLPCATEFLDPISPATVSRDARSSVSSRSASQAAIRSERYWILDSLSRMRLPGGMAFPPENEYSRRRLLHLSRRTPCRQVHGSPFAESW